MDFPAATLSDVEYRMTNLFDIEQEVTTSDDYLTPKWVFDLLGVRFDLDVAASPFGSYVPADRQFTKADDGLEQTWRGKVWMNPPYSEATPWVRKFLIHGNGIALLPHAKSRWHLDVWNHPTVRMVVPPSYFNFEGGSIPYPVVFVGMGDWTQFALGQMGVVR